VAKEAFARSGASTSLDDMAKQVGVGAGTLYRHFPTSDALLETVYRTEVEKLAAAERKLAQGMRPIEALRSWMLLFVDYIATKQIIAPALNTLVGGPSKGYEASRAQIAGAIHATTTEERISGRAEPHPESPNQRQVGCYPRPKKATLAEIAHRLGRKALEELSAVAKPDTLLANHDREKGQVRHLSK
jgi:AcrR family transcriptional regulator